MIDVFKEKAHLPVDISNLIITRLSIVIPFKHRQNALKYDYYLIGRIVHFSHLGSEGSRRERQKYRH